MSWSDLHLLTAAVCLAAGAGLACAWMRWKQRQSALSLREQERALLETAQRESGHIIREARIAATEEALKIRGEAEAALAQARRQIGEFEQRIAQREAVFDAENRSLQTREKQVDHALEEAAEFKKQIRAREEECLQLAALRRQQLELAARLPAAEARELLLKEVEEECLRDANDLSHRILASAKARAEDDARKIITVAIQRYAGSHTSETTTSIVGIQGDEIKGRIIGREGRNIRCFEAATGVTVLIDDTPNAVVLSGFDPVRRAIAREAMQRLILDGRIHPTRIEEVVAQVGGEMEESIQKAGEEAVYQLGLAPLHTEIVRLLGALRFRQSFTQNLLDHSIEVAHIMGLLASELGLDISVAKRCGLLHDIGKGLSHEVEGSHAGVGADFIKCRGESDDIVNAVASHHDEVPHTNLYGILVSAADAISASRPGARSETMTTYIRRLEDLERIGASFPGVDKCFAIQAGRELRVVVHPSQVSDDQALALSRQIVRRIEDELQYPGQIRITVVRETRCIEYAK